MRAIPIRDSAGAIERWFGTHTDITEQREIEEAISRSEERYRTLVSVITDVPWVTDPQGAFVEVQPAWAAYTGQSWEQYRVFGWIDALHADDRARVKELWEHALATHTTHQAEGRIWHASSQAYRHITVRAAPLFDGEGVVHGWVGACSDVEESRRAEHGLREADRQKSLFLATLAHELRNPLAPLRNGLELMSADLQDKATHDQAHGMMSRQLDQLVYLINDLMDVSRISRGVINLNTVPLDLRKVLEQAVETSRPLIDSKEHTLIIQLPKEPLPVSGDNMRLVQVFLNLLNNAAKYTDAEGTITLHAELSGDEVVVTVTDNGIGIAEVQTHRVFDMFAQVERQDQRTQGGLGIGLNIVYHLVQLHKGSVEVRSAGLGQGSTFTVRLPLAHRSVPQPDVPAEQHEQPSAAAMRILIVDDNVDAAVSTAMLLGKLGHEVRTAHNGVQALDVGEVMRPQIVLMDIGMPVMDGYTACEQMRRTSWGRQAFIVAVTGWGQDEDKRRTAEAGFDQHLVNPMDRLSLLQTLAMAQHVVVP